jgi:hypothetical protein
MDQSECDLAAYLSELPLLTPRDRQSVLCLLSGAAVLGRGTTTATAVTGGRPPGFDSVASVSGVHIVRSKVDESHDSDGRPDIFRVSGLGRISAPARHAFEMVSSLELIGEFDLVRDSGVGFLPLPQSLV